MPILVISKDHKDTLNSVENDWLKAFSAPAQKILRHFPENGDNRLLSNEWGSWVGDGGPEAVVKLAVSV